VLVEAGVDLNALLGGDAGLGRPGERSLAQQLDVARGAGQRQQVAGLVHQVGSRVREAALAD